MHVNCMYNVDFINMETIIVLRKHGVYDEGFTACLCLLQLDKKPRGDIIKKPKIISSTLIKLVVYIS